MGTKLLIRPRTGGETIEEMPANIVSYGYRANRPGAISFTCPLDHPKTLSTILDVGVNEATVERDGTIVWAGPIQTSDENDTGRLINFAGEGLLTYLRKMHITTTLTYSSSTDDQYTIARGLIAHHQNKAGGDFNIDTTAATLSGQKRTRTYNYWEHKNVYDAVIELSEMDNGFDLAIDPATRTLDLYYPRQGQRRTDIVFDERNIRRFSRQRDATRQASHILAIGSGEEDAMLRASVQSSTAVAAYGLTQKVISLKDVTVESTLIDHANDALNVSATVPNLIAIDVSTDDPGLFSYGVGDEVQVRWASPYETVNEYQRIIGLDVVWRSGEETATIYLVPI